MELSFQYPSLNELESFPKDLAPHHSAGSSPVTSGAGLTQHIGRGDV